MGAIPTRPVLRWLLPAGVAVAVIGGGVATSAVRAAADPALPPRSAAQLLVDLQTARLDGLSGTVVERADLGLPALPTGTGGEGSSRLSSLVTGSHTLRVWYSGPDRARIALLGTLGESDVIANGDDVWIWSSDTNSAVHQKINRSRAGSGVARTPLADPTHLPVTPQQAADRALAAIDATTSVRTDGRATVAGRAAYELVLSPRDAASKVASVRIAVDGRRHVPLRVQVYARGHAKPAAEVGFTQVDFGRPDAGRFRFNPPPGVKVTEDGMDKAQDLGDRVARSAQPRPVTVGTGWTAVIAANASSSDLFGTGPAGATGSGDRRRTAPDSITAIADTLPRVSGSWGSGRLLSSRLFSVLLTDDGRVFAGAVDADTLYAAAADPATAGLKATK